jgi:hypothetical protein
MVDTNSETPEANTAPETPESQDKSETQLGLGCEEGDGEGKPKAKPKKSPASKGSKKPPASKGSKKSPASKGSKEPSSAKESKNYPANSFILYHLETFKKNGGNMYDNAKKCAQQWKKMSDADKGKYRRQYCANAKKWSVKNSRACNPGGPKPKPSPKTVGGGGGDEGGSC